MENTIQRETESQQEKTVQQEKVNQQDKTIQQIYDKAFKKVLTLSSKAVINMINGLFEMRYPTYSTVTYNWTEFEDKELKRILADTIVTIAGTFSYHMEAQMTKEDDIHILNFPEVRVIYLYAGKNLPEEYNLYLDFGTQGRFCIRCR